MEKDLKLPDGRIALSKEEIDVLKIKIGKKKRSEKDWTFIKELLIDRVVFTANPMDEDRKACHCVEGVLKDGNALVAFTSVDTCTDYLDKIGIEKYGSQMEIGNIPFKSLMEIAIDYRMQAYIDPNDPTDMKILAIDGKTQTYHVFALVRP